MEKTYIKWIIIGAVIIVIIALYLIFKPKPVNLNTNTNTNTNPNTLSGSLATIFAGIFSSAWIKNLFSGGKQTLTYCQQNPWDVINCNSPTDCYNGCKSSMPGYDCNGNPSANC